MLQLTESDLNRAKATAEIRALTRFAHRKDGVQVIGERGYPLAQAIADVQSEYRIDPAPAFATVTDADIQAQGEEMDRLCETDA